MGGFDINTNPGLFIIMGALLVLVFFYFLDSNQKNKRK